MSGVPGIENSPTVGVWLSGEVKQSQSPSSHVVKPQSRKGERLTLLASAGDLARPRLAAHPDLYRLQSCLKGACKVPARDYSKHFISENVSASLLFNAIISRFCYQEDKLALGFQQLPPCVRHRSCRAVERPRQIGGSYSARH